MEALRYKVLMLDGVILVLIFEIEFSGISPFLIRR